MFRWGVEGGRPAAGRDRHRARVVLQGQRYHSSRRTASRSYVPRVRRGWRRRGGDRRRLSHRRRRAAWRIGMATATSSRITLREEKLSQSRGLEAPHMLARARARRRSRRFDRCRARWRSSGTATTIWSQEISTGEADDVHSLRNIEHHHFKFDGASPAGRRARPLLRRVRPELRRRSSRCERTT